MKVITPEIGARSTDGIGKITTGGTITPYYNGITNGSRPTGITVGPDGNLWFTEFGANDIGKFVL